MTRRRKSSILPPRWSRTPDGLQHGKFSDIENKTRVRERPGGECGGGLKKEVLRGAFLHYIFRLDENIKYYSLSQTSKTRARF